MSLRREGEQNFALLSVRDQGIGIPSGQQARLFRRFVREENARATEITGTGLGIYLSRELVEQHGGQLWFESAEGGPGPPSSCACLSCQPHLFPRSGTVPLSPEQTWLRTS